LRISKARFVFENKKKILFGRNTAVSSLVFLQDPKNDAWKREEDANREQTTVLFSLATSNRLHKHHHITAFTREEWTEMEFKAERRNWEQTAAARRRCSLASLSKI
jgi:hypothetical protein